MSEIHLTQFLKQYGLHGLGRCDGEVAPGDLLGKRFLRHGVERFGHLSETFTSMPKWFWDAEVDRANLVHCTVTLPRVTEGDDVQVAIEKLADDLAPGNPVMQSSIAQASGRTFRIGPGRANKFSLLGLLNNLRATQPDRWRRLEEKWVVLEVYYVTAATLRFRNDFPESSGTLSNDADEATPRLEKIGPRQATLRQLEIPFAFSGFRV